MGHAGAMISGSQGTDAEKIATFRENGVEVAERPLEVPDFIASALGG